MPATLQGARTAGAAGRPRRYALATAEHRDVLRISVSILIVMVVSRVHQIFHGLAALRPALLVSLVAIGYAVAVRSALTRENVLKQWWTRVILAVVIQAQLSVLFGISTGNSGKFVLLAYSTVLMLMGLIVYSMRSWQDLVTFVVAFMFGLGALAYQTNFMFKLTTGSGLSRLNDMFAFDANDVGLIFVTGVPLVSALVTVWSGYKKPLLLVLLAAIGVGIARTGSRGAFLALVVSGAALLLFNRGVPTRHRLVFAAAVVVALFIAAPPGYFDQMMSIKDPKSDYNWTSPYGRREIAKRGIGYMIGHPIFGIGINNFRKAECTISPRVFETSGGEGLAHCAAPHNTWVQVGAELGIPGLILWFVMLAYPMTKLFRLSRKLPLAWRRGDTEQRFLFACAGALPISILAFMIASSFLTFAWIDLPYLLVIFAGSTWLFARRRLARDDVAVMRRYANREPRWDGLA